jgi:hypothetical protein
VTRFRDLTGQRFGRWLVVGLGEAIAYESAGGITDYFYRCVCECGKSGLVRRSNLRSGGSRSCGCLAAELAALRERTHGYSGTRLYRIWVGIKQRCTNPSATKYEDYGGRGIAICARWRDGFEHFLADVGESYREHVREHGERRTSLDRIDGDGHYEPQNCRWGTPTVQARNHRPRAHRSAA